MENVILGRLIPAGSGFAGSSKAEMIAEVKSEIQSADEEGEEVRG